MSIVDSFLEIRLAYDDDFLKVKETLTRIGIASPSTNTLYQSCHILHKQGRLYIVHFKEMFLLDGKSADFTEEDLARRNTIAKLLDEWGLLEVVDKRQLTPLVAVNQIRIIPFKQKQQWTLISKYTIGKK